MKKKILVGLVATGAVVAIAAFFCVRMFLSGDSGSGNAYIFYSDGQYELVNDIENSEVIDLASGENELTEDDLLSFSPDGQYVGYYINYDSSAGTGDLYRAEYGRFTGNVDKNENYTVSIAENVCIGFQFLNDGSMLYQDDSGTLYYFDGEESVSVVESVTSYYTNGDGRVIYLVEDAGDASEGSILYGVKLSDIDNPVKLASNVSFCCNIDDFDHILYVADDDSQTLYAVGFEKESQKLGEEAEILEAQDGKTYFTAVNGSSLLLYDYVTDEYAEADSAVAEPELEDYLVNTYDYTALDSSVDPDDYETLYTSCTNASSFYSYWFSYRSMEFAAAHDSKHQDAYNEFIDKYKSQEDEDGYFVVTDQVREDLIALASSCGAEEEDWILFCFCQEISGTDYDYDAYNDACEQYSEVLAREELRETLQDEENAYPLRTLYCYEDGELTAINETLLSIGTCSGAILFNTCDLITDTVEIADISSTDSVTELFEFDPAARNYFVIIGETSVLQMTESFAESYAEAYEGNDAYLFFAENMVYMGGYYDTGDSVLAATITDDGVGDFTVLFENAGIASVEGSTLYYICKSSETGEEDSSCCDLYSFDGTESKCLAQNIFWGSAILYENGCVAALTENTETDAYDITFFDTSGEMLYADSSITQWYLFDESSLLFISDDDLYIYDGQSANLVQAGVENLWCTGSVEKQKSFGLFELEEFLENSKITEFFENLEFTWEEDSDDTETDSADSDTLPDVSEETDPSGSDLSNASEDTAGEIRDEFKEAVDDYEAAAYKLAEIMDAMDVSEEDMGFFEFIGYLGQIGDYMEALTNYNTAVENLNQFEEEELNTAEWNYYLEALERVNEVLNVSDQEDLEITEEYLN